MLVHLAVEMTGCVRITRDVRSERYAALWLQLL